MISKYKKGAYLPVIAAGVVVLWLGGCQVETNQLESNQIEMIQTGAQSVLVQQSASAAVEEETEGESEMTAEMITVNITIGDKIFQADFYNTETANALIGRMPMTLPMTELHGNEKYYNFPDKFPTQNAEQPDYMQAGDIMLWRSNCLVLFYETFSNSFGGYDRIGYIRDLTGLKDALGNGNLDITFSLAEPE